MNKDELIQLIMKEPYPLQLSQYEEKMRRNLLAYSVAAISACLLGAAPSKSPVLLGLVELKQFNGDVILYSLSALVLYELVNYGSSIFNSFSYWRVRLTGTRLDVDRGSPSSMGGEDEQADYSGDERNSTIYTWMFERAPSFHAVINNIEGYGMALQKVCARLDETHGLIVNSSDVNSNKDALMQSINKFIEYNNSVRINESMKRFDNWFNMMIRSQSIRWLVLDCILPILLALIALVAISQSLFHWIPDFMITFFIPRDVPEIDSIIKVISTKASN